MKEVPYLRILGQCSAGSHLSRCRYRANAESTPSQPFNVVTPSSRVPGALCRDVHPASFPGLRRGSHDDLDVPTQRIEKVDEPLRGKATEPATKEV
jgi:hypothetical protein